jgi:hypothetical protein
VCDCSDQAAHYHNLGPQLGASLLTQHIGWKQKQEVYIYKKRGFVKRVHFLNLCISYHILMSHALHAKHLFDHCALLELRYLNIVNLEQVKSWTFQQTIFCCNKKPMTDEYAKYVI